MSNINKKNHFYLACVFNMLHLKRVANLYENINMLNAKINTAGIQRHLQ